MTLLTNENTHLLWQDTLRLAENRCSISLGHELEAYLISLLMRYTSNALLAKRVLAISFLEAQQQQVHHRAVSLQAVGDECLLYAGLFPQAANKRQVKISYYVDLGRSAYISISHNANDLFETLAMDFVVLMDVLQSIGHSSTLMPLEAYELWHDVGSQRAYQILQSYTKGSPIKTSRR